LAKVTLPIVAASPLRTSFDEKRNAWVIVSANRNLRLVGRFTAPVPGAPVAEPEGTPGFGFVVTVVPSHMQVVEFENRYYLRRRLPPCARRPDDRNDSRARTGPHGSKLSSSWLWQGDFPNPAYNGSSTATHDGLPL